VPLDESLPGYAVIVPAKNAAATVHACLSAIAASSPAAKDIILVDDGSADATADIASGLGAKVIRLNQSVGPGAARNRGAQATDAEILVFVDSDVVVRPETIRILLKPFRQDPLVVASFGSYDDRPHAQNFAALYANLRHHFVHQMSVPLVGTFWAGCGAVRRREFMAAGGFDERYRLPSIEDIELGSRLTGGSRKIVLVRTALAQHLKAWTVASLWKADIFRRAIPWTRLIAAGNNVPGDLNLQSRERASALFAHGMWLSVLGAYWFPPMLAAAPVCAVVWAILQFRFLRFLFERMTVPKFAGSVTLHWIYFLYASCAFALVYPAGRLMRPAWKAQEE
jgi:glycosyltransferase involved in cell wall biosynthesis